MKKRSARKHRLCVICLFVRTYGLSRRPHQLDIVSFAGALTIALVVAGMAYGMSSIITVGIKYSKRTMNRANAVPRHGIDQKQNGAPLQGAPFFFLALLRV